LKNKEVRNKIFSDYYCKIDQRLKNRQVIAQKRNTCQNIKKKGF